MHRFKLHQKRNYGVVKVYALMNGVYDGGNDYERMKNGIECEIDSSVGKFFSLTVKDDDVKLTSKSDANVISLDLKHGDVFDIDRDRFELIKYERPVNRKDNRSSGFPCYRADKFPCHNLHNPMDEWKADNRIDCPYPRCLFACWCIADLNEHIVSYDGHSSQYPRK